MLFLGESDIHLILIKQRKTQLQLQYLISPYINQLFTM